MTPGGHKELLWRAFERYGFESSADNIVLDLSGLRSILKELGLSGQEEVVSGIWKAMGGGDFVDWTAYSQVMLSITNAGPTPTPSMASTETFDDIEVVPHQSGRNRQRAVHYSPPRHARVIPEFSSPLDLPDERDDPVLETSTSRISVANQLHEPVTTVRETKNREAAISEKERQLADREAHLHHLQHSLQSLPDERALQSLRERERDLMEREQEFSRMTRMASDPKKSSEKEDELNRRELALRRLESALHNQQQFPTARSASQQSMDFVHRDREESLIRKEAELRGWEESLRQFRSDADLRRQIDEDARDREGRILLRELTTTKIKHKKDIEVESTISSVNNENDQLMAREAAMGAREQASTDTRARHAFRSQESDQRINIQELEVNSRTDIILRYWRKITIKLEDVSEREFSLQSNERKLAAALRELDLQREDFRREQLTRPEKYQFETYDRERELAQKITDLAAAEAKMATERELFAKQIHDREKLLSMKEENMKHLDSQHQKLEQDQKNLSERERNLSERERKLSEGERTLAEHQLRITTLEQEAKQMFGHSSQQERDFNDKLAQLASREEDFASREKEIADRAALLGSREEDLMSRDRDLQNRMLQMNDANRHLSNLSKREEDLNSREEKLRERESGLRDREDIVRSREEQIRRQEDILSDRDSQIEAQHRKLKQLEFDLHQREDELDNKRKRALGDGEDQRSRIQQLKDQLHDKEAKLHDRDAKLAVLQARIEEREKMSREWDQRVHQRGVGEDNNLQQQLADSAQRLNEAIARATNSEVRCVELQRRLDAGEASGDREKVLQQHESLLQAELQRVGAIEHNLQEREKSLEKRKVAIERWIATLTKREAALQSAEDRLHQSRDGEDKRAAAQNQEYLDRERLALAEKERQLESLAMKVKGQEMEWIAWGEVVKQRESDTLRELTQLKADLAAEELSKKAAQQKLETNTAIQETSRILSEARSDTDLVLEAARRLYEKTVGMQEQLDRRQRDLDVRESVLHVREASIPPPLPIAAIPPPLPVDPMQALAQHAALLNAVPSPTGSIFDVVPLSTHRDLERYDVLHGLNGFNGPITSYHPPIEGAVDKPHTPFLPPVCLSFSVSDTNHIVGDPYKIIKQVPSMEMEMSGPACPSPMCDYEIEIPCGSEAPPPQPPSIPSVDDIETTVVDGAPVPLPLETPCSWYGIYINKLLVC